VISLDVMKQLALSNVFVIAVMPMKQ
jgi:hypothetical protein